MEQQRRIFSNLFIILICIYKSYQNDSLPYFSITAVPEEIPFGYVKDCNYLIPYKKLICDNVGVVTIYKEIFTRTDRLIKFQCNECSLAAAFDQTLFNDTLKTITSINLSNMQLYPNQNFTKFTNANSITLVNCNLNVFNQKLYPADNLKLLKLRKNLFQFIPEITGFDQLETLNLSSNGINEIHVDAFTNLKSLKHLDLSDNNLKKLPENLFSTSSNIHWLKLNHNRLFAIPINLFDGLTSLQKLDVSYNPIFDVHYEDMFRYKLKTVQMYHLDGLPCSTLKNRIMNYIKSEFFEVVYNDTSLGFKKFVIKQESNDLMAPKLTFTIALDLTKKQWFESDYGGIKCVDYFNPNWEAKRYLQWKNEPVVKQIDGMKKIVQKFKEKNVFSIEMLALENVLKDLQAVYN